MESSTREDTILLVVQKTINGLSLRGDYGGIMHSQNKQVQTLTKEIYGNGQGLGVLSNHTKYPQLLKTIKETNEAYKFIINSPFVKFPLDLLEGIHDLGLMWRLPKICENDYTQF